MNLWLLNFDFSSITGFNNLICNPKTPPWKVRTKTCRPAFKILIRNGVYELTPQTYSTVLKFIFKNHVVSDLS